MKIIADSGNKFTVYLQCRKTKEVLTLNKLSIMGNTTAKLVVAGILITAGYVVGSEGLKQAGKKVLKNK